MKNLIIIGNGFDLAHNIASKYSDFQKYICRTDLIVSLEKYIYSDDLWNSFEYALSTLDYDQLKDDNSEYYISYADDNWSESANHDYQEMIGENLQFANEIAIKLKEWILELKTNVEKLETVENILNDMDGSCKFLSFNYTDTLEITYNVPRGKILYIHGKAIEDLELIVGHNDDSFWTKDKTEIENMSYQDYERYMETERDRDFREVEAENEIINYFKSTYKDTNKIIDENIEFFNSLDDCEKIYVLGHSLSDIDINYFKKINSCVSSKCVWCISTFGESDKRNKMDFTKNLGIESFSFVNL